MLAIQRRQFHSLLSVSGASSAEPPGPGLATRLVRYSIVCLGLALPGAQVLAQILLPPLPNAQTGTLVLDMSASAYYDSQYFTDRSTDGRVLSRQMLAQDVTSYQDGSGVTVATSFHQATSRATVSPTSIKLYSKSVAEAWTASPSSPSYSSFANSRNNASATTPFIVPSVPGGPASGSAGTLQATLLVSGSVTVDPYFNNPAKHANQSGRAYMYFWATGLNASGCTYYTDAGCLDVIRNYPADTINSNNALRAWTLDIPFRFDELSSFNLTMMTFADSSVTAGLHGDSRRHQSESDFGHTLRWGGIQAVLDDQGRPVTGWGISTLPGLDLRVAAVPEPGTWALMLGGLLALVALKRRGDRQRA